MPWRNEQVAPYCYEYRYVPDRYGKFYYSTYERSQEEIDDLYHRMNNIPRDPPVREPEPTFWQQRAPEPEPPKAEGISVMKPITFKAKKGNGRGPGRH